MAKLKITLIYSLNKLYIEGKMKVFFKYRYLMTAIVIVVYYVLFNSLQADSSLTNSAPSIGINVMQIPQTDITVTKQYIGYVTPIQQAEIASNVSGYIDEVLVSGGSEVKVGDNLVLIDQKEYKSAWDAAKAATVKAKADYNNALSYYKRMKKAGHQAVSAADLDNAKAAYLSADAAWQQAKALEQKAKTSYDYTILQAPIAGIIGNINLTKGNYINPNARLFSVVQFDPIRVVFAVPDKEFTQTDITAWNNENIALRLPNGKMYEHSGIFKYADNQIDKSTNSINLYADFANPGKQLLANSYVDVFITKKIPHTFIIRKNYAQIKDDGIWAYIAQNNKIKEVKLDISDILDDFYAVSNNFSPDEYLVIDKIGAISPDTKLSFNIQKKAKN